MTRYHIYKGEIGVGSNPIARIEEATHVRSLLTGAWARGEDLNEYTVFDAHNSTWADGVTWGAR